MLNTFYVPFAYYMILFAVGAVMGSFANTVAYRLVKGIPLNGHSICPKCGHRLYAKDVVPIISYLNLKGRCRYCRKEIPLYYPVVELLEGVLFMFLFYRFGWSLMLLKYAFMSVFTAITFIMDLRYQLVSDFIALILFAGGITFAVLEHNLLPALLGSALLGGFFAVLVLITRENDMGWGDVTYSIALGSYTDIIGSTEIIIVSFLTALVVGLVLIAVYTYRKKSVHHLAIPFCPFLTIGAFYVVFFRFAEPIYSQIYQFFYIIYTLL